MNKIAISQVENGFIVKVVSRQTSYSAMSVLKENYDDTFLYVFGSKKELDEFLNKFFDLEEK